MATYVLGITAYRRDSAAALICDGDIVAAAREQSFSRRAGDSAFPAGAIAYCLREAELTLDRIDLVVYCDLLQSGGGLRSIVTALRRAQLQTMLRRELAALAGSGRLALPPLSLVLRSQAEAELVDLPASTPEPLEGKPVWRSDAASAIGAALHGWHRQLGNHARISAPVPWLGPWFGSEGICAWLDESAIAYRRFDDEPLIDATVQQLLEGHSVGWLQGRLEFCERSLGARSILLTPQLDSLMTQASSNGAWRPVVMTNDAQCARDWLQQPAQTQLSALLASTAGEVDMHVVEPERQPRLYRLLAQLDQTGFPLLVSLDFQCDAQLLVATPAEAYRSFMRSDLDCLVMEEMLLLKRQQPLWEERGG